MAYESKIIVVATHRTKNSVCAEQIATLNLCCMGYDNGWKELFDREIDYELYRDDGNTMYDTDMYGEHLKSCPVEKVIAWVEAEMERNNYRRLPLIYGLLKSFDPKRWPALEVVHYGY